MTTTRAMATYRCPCGKSTRLAILTHEKGKETLEARPEKVLSPQMRKCRYCRKPVVFQQVEYVQS